MVLKEISQSNPYLSAPAWFGFLATNTSYLFTAYTRKKIDEYEYFLNKVFSIISKYDQSESIKNYLFTKVSYSTF